jgi:protein-tyrosine phosphatase
LRSRVLAWDGCVNVRDLGGLPLEGGGETRFGVCVRADSIRALTGEGWRALADYGVRLAVDLRGDAEVADDPPAELPIEVVRFSVPGEEVPEVREWPSMLEAYRAFLRRFRPEFAGAAGAVAREDGPVVVHCYGGRDRTGLACALMLRLAGVPLDVIAADHALSDEHLAPLTGRWHEDAPDEPTRQRRRRVTTPAGRTMAEVLAGLDVRGYLLAGGAAPAELDTLVLRLRP